MRKIDYHTMREIAIFTVVFLSLTIVWSMAYILPSYFCKTCDSEQMKEIGCGILVVAPFANFVYVVIKMLIEIFKNKK